MTGFSAVAWKEMREQYLRGGRPTVSLVISGVILFLAAAIPPFAFAAGGTPVPALLVICASIGFTAVGFLSLMTPVSVVIDTIAGERERHTLETLLASPASDGAILMGKAVPIGIVVAGNALWYSLVSLVCLTIAVGLPGLLVGLLFMVAMPISALMTASYTTGLGLFISQRAPTIKQGQQWLVYSMMPFYFLPGLAGSLGRFFVGADAQALAVAAIIAAVAGGLVFVGLNVLFWVLAFTRFRRDRLLLR